MDSLLDAPYLHNLLFSMFAKPDELSLYICARVLSMRECACACAHSLTHAHSLTQTHLVYLWLCEHAKWYVVEVLAIDIEPTRELRRIHLGLEM